MGGTSRYDGRSVLGKEHFTKARWAGANQEERISVQWRGQVKKGGAGSTEKEQWDKAD